MYQLPVLRIEGNICAEIDEVQRVMEPSCTNRAAKGMWYQMVSGLLIPWCKASTVRVLQSATTTLVAARAAKRALGKPGRGASAADASSF